MIGQAHAQALLVVAQKYHASLQLQLAVGGAPQWVRTEAYRVGVLLGEIEKGPPAPAPSGMYDKRGNV